MNQSVGAPVAVNELANEFRIFRSGVNPTLDRDYVFDARSAASVIQARARWNVRVMIDLEHLSLDKTSPNYNPAAYGWCDTELRNGELWAVNVRWTPLGTLALISKTAQYVSPVFHFDSDGRIIDLWNLALVAMPATLGAESLFRVAASANLATLSAAERRICAETGCDPAVYLELREARAGKKPDQNATGQFGLTRRQLQICKETGCSPASFATMKRKMNL